MDEVTKCRYIDCVDTQAKEEKEEILHELPVCDIGLCVKWLINSGHVELIGRDLSALRSMKFFLCNNHFTEDCYLSKGTLKETAVPSPHWSTTSKTFKAFQMGRNMARLNGNGNSMVAESERDKNRWCRTCATKKFDLVSMTAKRKGTEMNLLSKLKLLIEIDEEDTLPTKMCDECVLKLEQSFKFFQQIYVADNTLRRVFSKTETNDLPRVQAYRAQWKADSGISNEGDGLAKKSAPATSTPKVGRGGFVKRGRGRPRTRGRPPKAKPGPQPGPQPSLVSIPIPIAYQLSCLSPDQSEKIFMSEPWMPEKESIAPNSEKECPTVFSLLTDTCRSDEELDWTDVLKVMNCANGAKPEQEEPVAKSQPPSEKQIENRDECKSECLQTPLIRCEFCNKAFKLRRQLRTHLLTHHCQLSRYMCSICLGSYESSALLAKHRALHHNQKYTCDYCKQGFHKKTKLRRHIKRCQTQYSCDTCGKTFAFKRVLVEHVKEHSETSNFTIPPDSDTSKLHVKEESMDWTDSLPFTDLNIPNSESKDDCPITTSTPVETTENTNLSGCTEDSLGIQDDVKEPKMEQCPDCDERIHTVEELGIHRMRIHSMKRKNSTCLLCGGKPFSSLDEYELHILEHCKRLKISL